MRAAITRAFADSIAAKRDFLRTSQTALCNAIETVAACFGNGGKLLVFGNGGSAADAQHLAAEFVNRYRIERPPLPAIALTTDTSALTSIANDFNFEAVFEKQVRALGKPGDVAIAISTSGNARNVLAAVRTCAELGIATIALTGGGGGDLARYADIVLRVGGTTATPRIQETHILIAHILCEHVEAILYPERGVAPDKITTARSTPSRKRRRALRTTD